MQIILIAMQQTNVRFFEINRQDVIGKFYCPDSIAQVSDDHINSDKSNECNKNIIKLEMVADALQGVITECNNKKLP